jgi:hypothetical protein
MPMVRQASECEPFGGPRERLGEPFPSLEECFAASGLLGRAATVAENWQADLPNLLASLAANLQARWKEAVRLEGIERDLLTLKAQVARLQHGCPSIVLIDSLAPEPLEVIRPFHVNVEPYEDEYRASFLDANLTAFGETTAEAIWALKDIIAATFAMLTRVGRKKLGPGPARQFEVLREFIRKP